MKRLILLLVLMVIVAGCGLGKVEVPTLAPFYCPQFEKVDWGQLASDLGIGYSGKKIMIEGYLMEEGANFIIMKVKKYDNEALSEFGEVYVRFDSPTYAPELVKDNKYGNDVVRVYGMSRGVKDVSVPRGEINERIRNIVVVDADVCIED